MASEINGSWEMARAASRRERRARAHRAGRPACRVHAIPGGAAPSRSVETALARIRGGAGTGLRRMSGVGAAHHTSNSALIWMAALNAASCQAIRKGGDHEIRWNCAAGRALYTNSGAGAETIYPLGVRLECGQTLSVSWIPGETGYSMEVYGRSNASAQRIGSGGSL